VKAPLSDDRPWDEIADWTKEIARYVKGEQADEGSAPRVPVHA
jgi:hypothetical protein